MIRKIPYSDIDIEKYDRCLATSLQCNFYAERKILDALCESWELLVYGDYEFVMPVPVKQKLGFKFVLMPLFCQQLGIFGPLENIEVEENFLLFLQKNYNVFSYAFNHHNRLDNLPKKKNYILEPRPYALLRKNYFKGRKSTVKSARHLDYKEIKRADSEPFMRIYFKGLTKRNDLEKFFKYLEFLEQEGLLKMYGAYKKQVLVSAAVTATQLHSVALLALINDENYRTENGASFLIDRLLQDTISDKQFDFMGGNIRGIEVFFKSFGSTAQPFPVLENSRKTLLKNLLRK